MVATDVAARGIDVPNGLYATMTYLLTRNIMYIASVERVEQAKEGKTYSVAGSRDKRLLRQIESFAKVKMEKYRLPSAGDLAKIEGRKVKNR